MEKSLTPYIRFSDDTACSNLPHLQLELSGSHELSLTLPYTIHFSIQHRPRTDCAKDVIFEWSAHIHGFTETGFILLHHTAATLEAISVDHSGLVDISRKGPLLVDGWNHDLWELTPEGCVEFQTTLPGRYQKLLKPGETYTLLWPGGKVLTWNFGTIREHIGQELQNFESALILPGGAHITFTTHTASPPWPIRSEREARLGFDRANLAEQQWRFAQKRATDPYPRSRHVERDPEAPIFIVTLECPSTYSPDGRLEVTVKVTYEAQASARPVTFHTRIFEDDGNYQLGRLRNGTWENHDDDNGECGFMIVDDPDIPVTVGQHDHFATIQPNESWTTTQRIGHNWTELPTDATDGESFRYAFTSQRLDWWNWGAKLDHEDTIVKLPCFLFGPVVDPKDNDGRPKLVVPTSNVVEFLIVK